MKMPAEWERHERTWMAWPGPGYLFGSSEADADEARATWASVANATVDFEPVTILVPRSELGTAKRALSSRVPIEEAELNDAWMRDIGPTFAFDGDELVAVNWVFNGWGAQSWANWDKDQHIGRRVAELAGVRVVDSPLVNEGGGIHVDGAGQVMATRTVQLDPGRNPNWNTAKVEQELADKLGTTSTVWLPRGLTRDSEEFGTRGHVDIVASYTPDGRVLVHDQRDEAHPDFAVTRQVIAALTEAFDATDTPREILRVPAPKELRDAEGWVDYSYINHLVANDAVIACGFNDANDAEAFEVLAEAYPGREIVPVDARPIFARGGGVHCITQQQPAR
jgi:agmatine deiminase